MRLAIIAIVGVAISGCATQPTVGSVAKGECQLTHTPIYAVKGKTAYDQEWADDTTEALVRGCKQARPKARPASLDRVATPAVRPAVAPAPIPRPSPVAPPAKKIHWWQKLKRKS